MKSTVVWESAIGRLYHLSAQLPQPGVLREAHQRPRRRRRHLVWLRTWNWWDRRASTLPWSIVQNMVLLDNDSVPAFMGRDCAAILDQLRYLRDHTRPFQSEAAMSGFVQRLPLQALIDFQHITA
jgi:hypothetical protein